MIQYGPLLIVLTFICSVDTSYYNANAFQNTIPIHAATRSALFRRQDGQGNGHPFGFRISRPSISPLNVFHRLRRIRFNNDSNNGYNQRTSTSSTSSSSSSTALNMVFTTPSSIIEQASTKILLDDLIDESVRSIPRTTVMMQFDPSSGWVSQA